VQVRRAYKFRAYLTRPQEGRAVRLLADHCDLYNAALEERREAWRMRKSSVCYGMQSAQLKDIRKTDPDGQGRYSFSARQQTLYRLNTAFAAFYKRAKAGRAGYPRFKPYSRFVQVRFVAGDGAKWNPANVGGWAQAYFQAVGSIKVRQHRKVPGTVKALPAEYLPNGAAAKSGLNKSILDAGWSQFVSVLAAKAEEAGRRVILVNPAYTSIDCHGCGSRCSRPRQDTVICPRCGPHDADVNGARNVYTRAGLGSGQARVA
jgi:transposase